MLLPGAVPAPLALSRQLLGLRRKVRDKSNKQQCMRAVHLGGRGVECRISHKVHTLQGTACQITL